VQDPLVAELRILCRDEMALIEERTALANQLQQALQEYYPTALEAFEDWTCRSSWAFVEAFPNAQALTRAGKRKWEKFLHAHRLGRPETYQKRLEIFATAKEWKVSATMVAAKTLYVSGKCRQLRALEDQLSEYRRRIEELFARHPDKDLFSSLPGAGEKTAPRLLSEIGSDRDLFKDPQSLQCMAGTAPVNFQSGQIHKVVLRRRCNKMLRQTMHFLAHNSRAKCSWADTYYNALRERGKTDAQALRCLGQRWLKIIWKMWQTRTAYDPELHMKNQLAHGSWVLKLQKA